MTFTNYRRNSDYVLRNIADNNYVIPISCENNNFHKACRINDLGFFIWNILEEDLDFDSIVDKCIFYCECDNSEEGIAYANQLKKDIFSFINQLLERKIIYPVSKDNKKIKITPCGSNLTVWERIDLANCEDNNKLITKVSKRFSIAGIIMELNGKLDLLPNSLDIFECINDSNTDITITVQPKQTAVIEILEVLQHANGYEICWVPDGYYIRAEMHKYALGAVINFNGSRVEIYANSEFAKKEHEEQLYSDELFELLGMCFMYKAQLYGYLPLHSASILYKGKAWLFSGPSGRGKSTHTAIWGKKYNVPIINGDVNIIAKTSNGELFILNSPWCGTSNCFSTEDYPLGGIILLHQSAKNRVVEIKTDEKILGILNRLTSPLWTENQLDVNLENVSEIVKITSICNLFCNIQDDAAETIKQWIDQLS